MPDQDLIAEGRAAQAKGTAAWSLWRAANCASLLDELEQAHARIAELEAARDQIATRLQRHRSSSTRNHSTGEYKNPVREGYDRGLTESLALLGVDAKEKFDV